MEDMGKELVAVSKVGGEVARCAAIVAAEMEAIRDEQTARQCMDDMGLLEAVLRRAHAYEEKAREYLTLECLMWFRIAEMCPEPNIKAFSNYERSMVRWVRRKTDEQRREIADACMRDGTGIRTQKRMDETRPNKRDQAMVSAILKYQRTGHKDSALSEDEWAVVEENERKAAEKREAAKRDQCKAIVDLVEEHGIVRCNSEAFTGIAIVNNLTDHEVRHMVEDTRDMLLQAGAIGLGDGAGTYIMPGTADEADVSAAISQRIVSVVRDICRITELVRRCGIGINQEQEEMLMKVVTGLVVASNGKEAAA